MSDTKNRKSAFMSMLGNDEKSSNNQEKSQSVKNENSQNQKTQVKKTKSNNSQNEIVRQDLLRKTVHVTEKQLETMKRLRRRLKKKDFEIEQMIFGFVFDDEKNLEKVFGKVEV